MWPAVPTVSGSAHSCGDLVRLGVGERSAVEQRASVADDGDHWRLVRPQRAGQLLLDRAGEARQLGQRQRAASYPRDGLLDGAAGRRGETLGAAENDIGGLAQHADHRDLVRPVEVERERPLERSERQLVRAEGAVERVAAQLLDQVGPAGDDPGLGAAQQLVPREADEVGPRDEGGGRRRLAFDVDERAGAEVVEER